MRKSCFKIIVLTLIVLLIVGNLAFTLDPKRPITPPMYTAEFWIDKSKNADKPLLDISEIEKINSLNENMIVWMDDSGGYQYMSLMDLTEEIPGYAVKSLISSNIIPGDTIESYKDGVLTSADYWTELDSIRNIDALPEKIQAKLGYSVCRGDLRGFPTDDLISETADDRFFDQLQQAELLPYEPLAVLHESTDGEWLYVAVYSYCGWVRKENVAICHSREQWLELQSPDEFLVVTGRELRLAENSFEPRTSGIRLTMGTKLRIVDESVPSTVDGRSTIANYVVSVPVRNGDGSLSQVYALVPYSEDVSVGYLHYTIENVLLQAFKFLGDRYGWGGSFNSNDCSGYIRQVYKCFGFKLGRNSWSQASTLGVKRYDVSDCSDEEKLKLLGMLKPGALLFFQGHITIYLGMEGSVPYVINSVGSLLPAGETEGRRLNILSVIVNDLCVRRPNGRTWLSEMTVFVQMTPRSFWGFIDRPVI